MSLKFLLDENVAPPKYFLAFNTSVDADVQAVQEKKLANLLVKCC